MMQHTVQTIINFTHKKARINIMRASAFKQNKSLKGGTLQQRYRGAIN